MSEGGTVKSRLEAADKALQESLNKWNELRLNPAGWRMGEGELLFRCELLALTKIIQDKLDISDDEMNIVLKTVMKEQFDQLLPQVMEQQAAMARASIMQGVPTPKIQI